MPFIPVANTARVCVKYRLHGQDVCNIMWFEKGSVWTGTDLNSLCTAINSWVIAEIMPHVSEDMTFVGTEARSMEGVGAPGVELPVVPGEEGGVLFPALPGNVAVAIKFLTGLTGRSFRGRNYIAGWPEPHVTGNSLDTTHVPTWVGAFEALASYLVGLAANHVVVSLFSGVDSNGDPIPRSSGVTTPVTNYDLDTDVDSMRKRLNGRGT